MLNRIFKDDIGRQVFGQSETFASKKELFQKLKIP